MCLSEITWNLFRHIMASDFCKEIANFCMASPQHRRNVKLKKLHCKSPRFHAYCENIWQVLSEIERSNFMLIFEKRAFSHQTKHFLGMVHKRKCVCLEKLPRKSVRACLSSPFRAVRRLGKRDETSKYR